MDDRGLWGIEWAPAPEEMEADVPPRTSHELTLKGRDRGLVGYYDIA